MKYGSASGSAKEIIIIIAFVAGLVIVFYMLAKREAEAAAEALKKEAEAAAEALKKTLTDTVEAAKKAMVDTGLAAIAPITTYQTYLVAEQTAWTERVATGQIPADIPTIDLPVLGTKEVVSVPSGGSTAFGSGTKEDDFIDIGYGVLVPAHAYFYNIKVW